LEAFAGYGFNKSHAVAYAITGYISQWFKVNYPIEFWVTAFKFGDDKKVANYISEIYRSGDIKIATPEINKSSSEFTVDYDTNTIYWSITSVKQAGEISQQQIEEDKKLNGHYFSFEEFLSRHVRKGSKVTKQIIENLVLSGVFDEIEEIKQPKDRIRLINFYRKEYKIKIDKEKDQFTTNEDSIGTNWWWSLQQKKICGFSLFEFDLLCETYLAESVPYYDAISIDEEKEKKEVTTGGYLNELVVRNGKKGEYAELTLDNNFEFVTVKIWQDEWKKVKPMIDGKEKILILLSGTVDHDNWKKKNVLYMNKDSSICVLE
jgi:DNA polymerase III subunit alpha